MGTSTVRPSKRRAQHELFMGTSTVGPSSLRIRSKACNLQASSRAHNDDTEKHVSTTTLTASKAAVPSADAAWAWLAFKLFPSLGMLCAHLPPHAQWAEARIGDFSGFRLIFVSWRVGFRKHDVSSPHGSQHTWPRNNYALGTPCPNVDRPRMQYVCPVRNCFREWRVPWYCCGLISRIEMPDAFSWTLSRLRAGMPVGHC